MHTSSNTGNESGLPRVSRLFMLRYLVAVLGVHVVIMTPAAASMALKVFQLVADEGSLADESRLDGALGVIMGVGAIVALVANPLFGQLSDLTRSRFGRRKPWIICGMVLSIAATVGIGFTHSLVVVALLWWVTQIAINASIAALIAIIPDRVPPQQRGILSALFNIAAQGSMVVGTGLAHATDQNMLMLFILPGAVGVIMVLLFALYYPEPEATKMPVRRLNLAALGRSFVLDPRTCPAFAWSWLSRFLVTFGVTMLWTYQVYYLMTVTDMAHKETTQAVFMGTTVMTIIMIASSVITGWLSDKIKKRKVFLLGSGVIATIALVQLAFSETYAMFILANFIMGLGMGTYWSVGQAFSVDVMPGRGEEAAKNMGILNIANVGSGALAPAVGPLFLAIGGGGNYTLLFLVAAVCTLVGTLVLLPAKEER